MRTNLVSMRTSGAAGRSALAVAGVRAPQQPGAARTAEQQYKNIKVLNGTPANQVVPMMHVIEKSLGVDCEFCHVGRPVRRTTNQPRKRLAR